MVVFGDTKLMVVNLEHLKVERLGEISACIRNSERQTIAFGSLNTKTGEILSLYVDPKHRNKGLATQIVDYLVERALLETELDEIFATTCPDTDADKIFIKRGWKQYNKRVWRLSEDKKV